MSTIIFLYTIVTGLAILEYQYFGKKFKKNEYKVLIDITLGLFLILFAVFRSQDLPDYKSYMDLYNLSVNSRPDNVEPSFFIICSIAKSISTSHGHLILLFIYAMIGISIKYYAINKYSLYPIFSFCLWLSSFFILHDLIQMRASVASGLFLLFLPAIQKKAYIKAIIIFIIAFCFHNSAIIFIPFFFLNTQSIKIRLWCIFYLIFLALNISGVFSSFANNILALFPDLDNARISTYVAGNKIGSGDMVNMFSPYILFQSIICFTALFSIKKLQQASPYAIIWLKCCFISIFIYSLSIKISMRLAELLSISHIFLIPLLIKIFPYKYQHIGSIIIFFISIMWLSFFIFNLELIPY